MKRVLVRAECSRKILEKKIFGRFFPGLIFRERSAPTIYLYETTIRRFLVLRVARDSHPFRFVLSRGLRRRGRHSEGKVL